MNDAPSSVVFDLGGVLIDWDPRHLYRDLIPNEAEMEKFLDDVVGQPWNRQQDAGRSIAEANAELIAKHPDKKDLIEAYYGEFDRMMKGSIGGTVEVLQALADIDEVRTRGLKELHDLREDPHPSLAKRAKRLLK